MITRKFSKFFMSNAKQTNAKHKHLLALLVPALLHVGAGGGGPLAAQITVTGNVTPGVPSLPTWTIAATTTTSGAVCAWNNGSTYASGTEFEFEDAMAGYQQNGQRRFVSIPPTSACTVCG